MYNPVTIKRITVLFICLTFLLCILAGCGAGSGETEATEITTVPTQPTETTEATEPTEQEPSIPQETHIPEASIITEQMETDWEEVALDKALASNDLRTQREWFYDFARQWRLDYMPQFTSEDGPPTDSWKYLYWCDFISYDYPAGVNPEMTRTYVENTVRTFFGTDCGDHRSHKKSYSYDEETEIYTPWPEGGKGDGYYLLNSIEDHGDGTYTVQGARYALSTAYVMPEEEYLLRNSLLNSSGSDETVTSEYVGTYGDTANLTLYAEFELTFSWDPDTSLPQFKALVVNILNDLYNW